LLNLNTKQNSYRYKYALYRYIS